MVFSTTEQHLENRIKKQEEKFQKFKDDLKAFLLAWDTTSANSDSHLVSSIVAIIDDNDTDD
jgi:hypothetical protein